MIVSYDKHQLDELRIPAFMRRKHIKRRRPIMSETPKFAAPSTQINNEASPQTNAPYMPPVRHQAQPKSSIINWHKPSTIQQASSVNSRHVPRARYAPLVRDYDSPPRYTPPPPAHHARETTAHPIQKITTSLPKSKKVNLRPRVQKTSQPLRRAQKPEPFAPPLLFSMDDLDAPPAQNSSRIANAPPRAKKSPQLAKNSLPAKSALREKVVGTVTHYLPKIRVAIIRVSGPFSVGDPIRIGEDEHAFTQTVESMQYNHAPIIRAPKGKEIGMQVAREPHLGDPVYIVL